MRWIFQVLSVAMGASLTIGALATEKPLPPVLDQNELGIAPGDQMERHLQGEIEAAWVRWKTDFESRTDPAEIQAHYARLRSRLVASIGGFPARTPLNAHITGVLERDGYHVEKVTFESQPGWVLTASLYLPDLRRFAPPYPGVLVPCGHYAPSKAHDEYQSMGALLALNGLAALVFDPIDQGERIQSLDNAGQPRIWGTAAHTEAAIKASMLGLSLARFMVWDEIRALDYLQSRVDIDPYRLGCTGNSGGATQMSYLLALDDRISAAAPSCYIHHLAAQTRTAMGDGEQNLYGQIAFGLDHPDYLLMRAPVPVKILAATRDFFPIDATWETFRLVKRAYTRLGASERIDILENEAGHNFNRIQREAAVRWLARWLLGRDIEIHEPALKLFAEQELRCTPQGQVLLLPGARSFQNLLDDEADRAATARQLTWGSMDADQQRMAVRRLAHFAPLAQLPDRTWVHVWSESRPNYRAEAYRVRTAEGVVLPALWLVPHHPTAEPALVFASAEGFAPETAPGARLDSLVKAGRLVLALDVRGTGETRQNTQQGASAAIGQDWEDIFRAFLLERPYVGMQVEDILAAVRTAGKRTQHAQVDLLAIGGVGVPALHAAFAEPSAFRHVTIERSLRSWEEVVRAPRFYRQFMNAIPGALQVYDLPDLAAALGSRATLVDSTNALGWSDKENAAVVDPTKLQPVRPGLTGVFYGSPNFINPQGTELLQSSSVNWNEALLRRGRDWSVRWHGFLTPDISGEFTVGVDSSEVAVVRLAGREVARSDPRSGVTQDHVSGETGKPIPIELEFNKPGSGNPPALGALMLQLKWKRRDSPWQPVPASWLHHSQQQELELQRIFR